MIPLPQWVPQFTPLHKWKHVSILYIAVVEYSWCCSYRFINLPLYSWIEYQTHDHLSILSRDLLTPHVSSAHCLYSDFTVYKWHSEHQREGMGPLPPECHSYLSDDYVRSASYKLPVAGNSTILQLSSLCPSSRLFDASVTASLIILRWSRRQSGSTL